MRCLDRASLVVDNSLTLGDVLPRFAALHADRVLVEEPAKPHGLRLTYTEAMDHVDRMAAGIAEHAGPGDRVVVAVPNGYEQLLLSLAACRAGAVAVPVNDRMRPEEIEHVIADSGAALVLRNPADALAREALDEDAITARRPAPGDVGAIFYTSGTTGRPKGAELTHRALAGSLPLASLWPSGLRRDEIVAALPVAHIMGFAVLLTAAATGVPVFSMTRFRPDAVLDSIERRRSTIFIGVPAMYRMLLEAGAERRDLRSIRLWVSGADAMPGDLARRFQRMGSSVTLPFVGRSLGAAMFAEGYGMVETGGAVAVKVSPPGLAVTIPGLGGSLGIPLPGCRFRVVGDDGTEVGIGQVGELLVKGPSVLTAYHGDSAATARVLDDDGWLHTGDLARRGLGPLVSFAGRAKDVIKSGGYSVYTVEVERVMEEHPEVLEAAALGLPDDRLGERTVVAVRVGVDARVTEADLLAWGEERLSSYKRPRAVRIVPELPRTGTQKVAKTELLPLFD